MTQRHRRDRKKKRLLYGAAAAVVATATIGSIAIASPGLLGATGDDKAAGDTSLQSQFANAAREFDVPQSVLMAVSYRQTRWESHDGQPSVTGDYNVMGLTKVDPEDLETEEHIEHLVNGTGDPSIDKKIDRKKLLAPLPKQEVDTDDPKLHTLDKAAELIESSTDTVQKDTNASIRAGAALLAEYQKQAGAELSDEPGDWYPAVARYSQSTDRKGADQFAERVFESIKTGEREITTDGEQVVLSADPTVEPVKPSSVPLAVTSTATTATTPECPAGLACTFTPAAYVQDLGNYNIASRVPYGTGGFDIRQIVIHDVEGTLAGAVSTFKDPNRWASAHYIVDATGKVTQMVETKNEAFHAGNKTVNMHSIGIEHEGYAIKGGSNWYKESQYDTTAELVKYLAGKDKYNLPLDREHIIGHDEVPGVLDRLAGSVHWDPGPFWDWNRFMGKVGATTGDGGAGGPLTVGQTVRVVPPFTSANQPTLTYREDGVTKTAAPQPANFGYLYATPSTATPISDPYLPAGYSYSYGDNWGNKVVAGGQYVVAGTSGDWTAIWYGSQKAWFYNPGGQYTSLVNTAKTVVKPIGTTPIKVYGRAYPNREAYAGTGVPIQDDTVNKTLNEDPLKKYTIPVGQGQAYVATGAEVAGDYYSSAYNADGTRVQGTNKFIPIHYNHRIAWVQSKDVQVVSAAAPVATTNRYNLLARDTSGVLWQYQGTGSVTTPYLTRYRISAGWNTYNTVTPMTALRADGTGDVMARDTTGIMWYFPGSGNASMPFKPRIKVSAGWQIYDRMVGVRDITGDGKADLLAREKSGVLWLFKGTGTPATPFAPRVKVSAGWTIYNELVGTGDLTGDGRPDVMARDTTGGMWIFKGTGTSTLFQPRLKISNGWQTYVSMVGPSDLNKDGKVDFTARDTTGVLWTFPGTGTSTLFAPRVRVGGGWQIYNLVF
ncbi:N-acetylmuramoyl-L-alanine amidase [Streptomyces sp. NBC_00233]|uniref:N-acetylmuramoyl-L-alanine amidase n=1 Tax=Streptomyces sp. NBC_00233 TaxID=2975686 RepID=UPI002257CB04|nr:N-acetylmuramoyl-L-alanine amidase [Streptomyces sp. NBC_00233]MCX5225703.1 N-acetylmuramoyl-L-alanine amidase [Streptomyces sp. NBC_00233]